MRRDQVRMWRGERGAAAVEFALIVPFFLTLIFGVIEFGAELTNKISMTNASRVGARYASLNVGNGPEAEHRAQDAASGIIGCSTPVATASYAGGSGTDVTLTVSCNYSPITPLGSLLKDIVLPTSSSATTKMVVE